MLDKINVLWYNISHMKIIVREYYESHRLSFKQISDQSVDIFGQFVSVDQMKKWSQEDGGWKKLEIQEDERLRVIGNRIFQMIEETEDLNARDLTALANAYLQIATKAPAETAGKKPTLQEIIDAATSSMDS